MVAGQAPDGGRVELLRSAVCPYFEQDGEAYQGIASLAEMRVQSGQGDRCLPRMLRLVSDRGHQPRTAGNGLAAGLWIGQPNEETPPVVDQCDSAGGELAAMQIMPNRATEAAMAT